MWAPASIQKRGKEILNNHTLKNLYQGSLHFIVLESLFCKKQSVCILIYQMEMNIKISLRNWHNSDIVINVRKLNLQGLITAKFAINVSWEWIITALLWITALVITIINSSGTSCSMFLLGVFMLFWWRLLLETTHSLIISSKLNKMCHYFSWLRLLFQLV